MESSLTEHGSFDESKGDDWKSEDLEDGNVLEIEEHTEQVEGGEVLEPYVGMEFDTEDDARCFYSDYARRAGFVMRVMQRRRSEIDGKTLARRLGCNKQGFSSNTKSKMGPDRKPRPSARGGCNAAILFKLESSGKWVVSRFIKDHNHPLVVTSHESTNMGDKEKKIQELTQELRRQEVLCAAYREKLINLMANVEKESEHMSSKVITVIQNIKNAEAEARTLKKHR